MIGGMIVQVVLNATDVGRHWSQFNDDVIRNGPRFVKRNRDRGAALNSEHLKEAFSEYTFNAVYFVEEDGSITVSMDDFDIVENGKTKDEAIDLLANGLIVYAHEYMDNFNLYFHSPNQREHFKFIMNVLNQDNVENVKELIEGEVGEI